MNSSTIVSSSSPQSDHELSSVNLAPDPVPVPDPSTMRRRSMYVEPHNSINQSNLIVQTNISSNNHSTFNERTRLLPSK
jgi:hypothetical protein